MKLKIVFLASVFVMFFTNVLEAQIVINADSEDVTIDKTFAIVGGLNGFDVRLNYNADNCYIIPFQLPTIPVGESITDVKLSFNVTAYVTSGSSTNIDLYGLGYRNTASVSLAGDYYAGANDVTDATNLLTDILTPSSGTGLIETNVSNLLTYIEDQYTAGAVTGDFVFLRLSPQSIGKYNEYRIASGDYWNTALRPTLTITTAPTGPVAPILSPIGNRTVEEDANLIVPISATDANGDALTYSYTGLPPFATFTDNGDGTASIDIKPFVGDEGVYSGITITVSDGVLTDSETFTITVTKLDTLIEIIATGATGFVSDPTIVIDGDSFQPPGSPLPPPVLIRNPETEDEMKIGKSDVVGEPNLTSAIIPFQLPTRPIGKTVQDVVLSVFVSFGREFSNAQVDLYGLPYQSVNTIFSADYYSGAFGDNQNGRNAVGLEEDLLGKTNPLGLLDTQRWVSTANNSALATFINDQYIAGAVAGDWIFFRLSVNNTAAIGYHYFVIDGGDGQGYNVDGTYNSTPKPPVLKLDFYNPLETTTTWDGSTWSNGKPDNILDAIVDGDISIAGAESLQVKNLTVQNNAEITINKGGNLVLHNALVIDAGSKIFIESGGSFKTANDAATVTVDGDFWVERISRPTISNYSYWSSPVNTTVQTALINSGSPRVYRFDTPTHNDANNDGQDDNFAAWIPVTGAMNPGQGYAAYGSDDGVTPEAQTVVFKAGEGSGVKSVHTGAVSINTVFSDNTANPNVEDWNLLGNPYPTAILARPFMVHNPRVGALYFWTHTYPISGNFYSVNDYAVYNLSGQVPNTSGVGGGVVPDGKIVSGQGFFTDIDSEGPVEFKSSMQIDNVYDDYNNNFYRGSASQTLQTPKDLFVEDRIWVDVYNDDTAFYQTLIAFTDEATNNFDHQYDAKMQDNGTEIMLYSIANNENLVIQGRPNFIGDEVIPLGLKIKNAGEQTFHIRIQLAEGILNPETATVYLLDNELGITHNLNDGEYTFIVDIAGELNDRFVLVFDNKVLDIDTEEIDTSESFYVYPNPVSETFRVVSLNQKIEAMQMYNIQGRMIKSFNVFENNAYNIENLSSGIYILRIQKEDGTVTTQKIIKR